jgi:hypothetical protein
MRVIPRLVSAMATAMALFSPFPRTVSAQCPSPLWSLMPAVTRPAVSPTLDLTFVGRGPTLLAIWSESGPTPVPHVGGTVKWAWSTPTGASISNFPNPVPLESGPSEYLFVATEDGILYRIDATSGTPSGSVDTRRPTCPSDGLKGAPAIQLYRFSNALFRTDVLAERGQADDLVTVITRNQCGDHTQNKVCAYWASDLAPAWTFNAGGGAQMDYGTEGCTVDYVNNRVICGTEQVASPSMHTLWSINTLNGALAWSANAGPILNRPMLADDRLYVATEDAFLRRYIATSGAPVWVEPLPGPVTFPTWVEPREPALRNRIYIVSEGFIHAFSDAGPAAVPLYPPVNPAPNQFVTAPVVVPQTGKGYVGRSDGHIQQFNLDTGALDFAVPVGPPGTLYDPMLDIVPPGTDVNRIVAPAGEGVARHCIPFGPVASVSPPAPAAGVALAGIPNPFRAGTTFEYRLPEAARVEVAVFGARGERLRTLVESRQGAGRHLIAWDGRDADGTPLPSGVYFCRIRLPERGDGWTEALKIELVR